MKSFSLAEMLFLFYIKSKQPICKNVVLHQNFFFPEHFSQLFRTYKKTNSAKLLYGKKIKRLFMMTVLNITSIHQ